MFGDTASESDDDSAPADALTALVAVPDSTEKTKRQRPIGSLADAARGNSRQTKPLEEKSESIAGGSEEHATSDGRPLKGERPDGAIPHQTEALALLKKAQDALQAEERELEAIVSEQKFAELKKDQSNNRKSTDGINEAAVQLGDAGAAARADLTQSAGSMMNAEGSLGGRQAGSASGSQGDAVESLKSARAKLAAEAEKLLNRLRGEIKKRTIEGIIQMLEGQIVIRQSTERLGPSVKDGARTVLNSVVALARAENKLIVVGEGLTSLVEETEFGIALCPRRFEASRREWVGR